MAAPLPPEQDVFDEAGYLRLYPDVVRAVAAGTEDSGWRHYHRLGRSEGRRPNDVDAAFYLRAYPQALADIEAGRAADAASHYVALGRARGYRPNRAAPRVEPGAMPAVFPWLWTDLPHAPDLIEGRRALGQLTERQADLLRRWRRDGYVRLEPSIDPRIVAAAALDLERAFAGACPDLLFSCGAVGLGPMRWQPEINPYPAAALDIHAMSHAIRALLFAEPVVELLGLLLEAPALLARSRGMLREAPQVPQRDSARAGYTLPGRFVSAWFVLEDAAGDVEAMRCLSGSHRPGTAAWSGANGRRLEPVAGKRGSVVVRHPDLLHGAAAAHEGDTRRGILAEYCPVAVAPLYFEQSDIQIWPHDRQWFTTRYYTEFGPFD